jgi:hypothetical protein
MKNKRLNDLEKLDGNKKPKVLGVLIFLFTAVVSFLLFSLAQGWLFG